MSHGKLKMYANKISWSLTGWKHLLFLSQKNSLLYSWSYHDESILHPGRLFTFDTSREGAYSRQGAYSGQGADFFRESNRNL